MIDIFFWRSLNREDFRDEPTEFGGYERVVRAPPVIINGHSLPSTHTYRQSDYTTRKIRDEYEKRYSIFDLGAAAKRYKEEAERREAQLKRDVDRAMAASVWTREPDRDFAERLSLDRAWNHNPCLARLMKAWLRDCDLCHRCMVRGEDEAEGGFFSWSSGRFSPKRLIDTAFEGSSERLALVENRNCHGDYIVLSHCWGTLTDAENRSFYTHEANIDLRLAGFSLADLPQAFRDAVTVTRQLGKRYLWIDSVCLIQDFHSPGNGRARRDTEAGLRTMDKVFASAYCTIAASCSTSSTHGFLRPDRPPPAVPAVDSRRCLPRASPTADFEHDVNSSPLNQRAWVLQERVLSRRTLHFSAGQVYFECGEAVRSDDFTKFTSAPGKDFFVQDPHFPARLEAAGVARATDFLQWLFVQYSGRGITVAHDRVRAILGLVERMQTVFGDGARSQRYGVFYFCLARLLLWRRADGNSGPRIDYSGTGERVPSWSWMAFEGEMEFLGPPPGRRWKVAVGEDVQIKDERRLKVKVRAFKAGKLTFHQGFENRQVIDLHGLTPSRTVGCFWPDQAIKEGGEIDSCVVVGYEGGADWDSDPDVHVIFVQKVLEFPTLGILATYKRVGVGEVKASEIWGWGFMANFK